MKMNTPEIPRLAPPLFRITKLAVVLGVVFWLFGDTWAHYRESDDIDTPIRFSHFGTYQDYELWRNIIADYERSHPNRKIKQEYILGLSGHYNTKMRQQILASDLPDVALIQLGPFHELAPHFADLTELLAGEFSSNEPLVRSVDATGLSAFVFDGIQRGLPVSGGSLQIYANVHCFERAGAFHGHPIDLPTGDWTMADFRRTAELLTCDFDDDGRIDQFGFWLPRWIYYLPFLWSFGAELTDDSLSQWRLNDAHAEEALRFYRNLAVGHRVCPRADEVPQLFQDVGFLTGKVAMCVNGPWFMPFLAKTRLANAYVVAPIPKGRAGSVTRITWDGIVLARNTQDHRRALAWDFMHYVLSKPVQDRIARSGRALPARRDSTGAFVRPPNEAQRRTFQDALSHSRLQPLLTRFGEMDRTINKHFRALLDPAKTRTVSSIVRSLEEDPVIRSIFEPRPTESE